MVANCFRGRFIRAALVLKPDSYRCIPQAMAEQTDDSIPLPRDQGEQCNCSDVNNFRAGGETVFEIRANQIGQMVADLTLVEHLKSLGLLSKAPRQLETSGWICLVHPLARICNSQEVYRDR